MVVSVCRRGPSSLLLLRNVCRLQQATAMDSATRAKELPPLEATGWAVVEGREAIKKTFNFKDFNDAWQWMSSVALHAEKANHHPEWFNVYNRVEVTWATHDDVKLTMKDVKMAKACDNAFTNFAGKK